MVQSQQEVESAATELTVEAFGTFCDDIATMFDTNVTALQVDLGNGTVKELKDTFKKLAAVCSVTSEGAINGEFHIVFDKDGVFTLPGTFVMQPEQVILQNRKNGGQEEAEEVGDALGEVGNLLVGAWDRVFRENLEDHKHFVQSGTFIGNPWTKPEESLRITKDQELSILTFEMSVDPLPPFRCAVVYPLAVFAPAAEPDQSEPEPADEAEANPDEQTQTDADSPETNPDDKPDAEPTPENAPDDSSDSQQDQPTAENTPDRPVSNAIDRMANAFAAMPEGMSGTAGILAAITAGDIMRTDLAWATVEDSIEQIIAIMQQHDTAYVLIGQGGTLEGIVSKSDVRGALSPYLQSMFAKWRNPMDIATLQIKAKWSMSRPVRTVRPDATIAAIMRAMTEHGGRALPVVDESGKVSGIVTAFDIFHALLSCQGEVSTEGTIAQTPPLV